jgi:hypothetical protein
VPFSWGEDGSLSRMLRIASMVAELESYSERHSGERAIDALVADEFLLTNYEFALVSGQEP